MAHTILLGCTLALLAACGQTNCDPKVTLVSISITPSLAEIAAGSDEQLVVTAIYSNGTKKDLPASDITWTSSNTGAATIGNSGATAGLMSTSNPGTTTITATYQGISISTTLTVTAATLVSIEVTPANSSIPDGVSQPFVATGVYSNHTTQNLTNSVTWSSAASTVATVGNTAGSKGVVTAKNVGADSITATLNGVSGSAPIKVIAVTLQSIEITGGQPLPDGTTEPLVATGVYNNGTTQNLTALVVWSSLNAKIATVSNTAGSNGVVDGTGLGSTSLSATFGGVSASISLQVTPATLTSIAVTPVNPKIADGTTVQLTATGTYSDGTTRNITGTVVWSSGSSTVAQVSNASGSSGLVKAIGVGQTALTATLGSVRGSTQLTTTNATLVSIAVTPATPTIANGTQEQFTATGTYSDGTTQNITSAVTWSSSAAADASISNASGSNGLATATHAGMTTIVAAQGTIDGSTALNVTSATLVSIAITPPRAGIAAGTTTQFTATGTYSDGTTQNLTSQVTWSSSSTGVATVSNAAGSNGLGTASAQGSTTLSASLGSVSGTAPLTVTAATLVSIAVTPTSPTVPDGDTEQFTATGTYTDGTHENLTSMVTWSSSSGTVAQVSNASGSNGLGTATAQGSTTVSAAFGGVSGSTPLTVSAATLVSLAITPPNPSIAKGTSEQFTATGTYSDNSTQDLTTSVSWSSSTTSTAPISNAQGSNGLATGSAVGTTTIGAALDGVSTSTGLTVTPATLVSIAVTPTDPGIPNGTTEQFTATGTYTDGTTQDLTSAVTWTSSTTGTATVSNAGGSNGLATSAAPGSTTISAALGSVSGSTPLTVTAATLVSIAVSPMSSTLPDGDSEQFTAIGTYTDGSTQDLTSQVTWSSASSTVDGISNASGSNGLATGTMQGSTNVQAVLGSVSGSTPLTVSMAKLVSLAITPPNPSIANGTTEQFTATGTYSDNSTQNLTTSVTWTSSSPNNASISNASGSNGLATGSAVGTTTIGAALDGVSTSTGLTVTPATLVSIAVTPTNPSIPNGTAEQFTATGTYSDGTTQNLTSAVSWGSSTPATASVSNASGSNGLATGVAQGSTTITAALGNVSGSTPLTVTPATLVSISVTPPNTSIANGTSTSFTATGTYSDGTTQNLTGSVTWSSSNTAVATQSNASGSNGVATSTGQGSTTVTAALGNVSGSTPLTVTAATLVSIGVTPANPTSPKGTTEQFTATGVYTDHTTQNLTSQVTWSSSTPATASISNASGSKGLASAAAQGTTTVTAVLGSGSAAISGSTGYTVTAAALTSIAVTPTNPAVADGLTEQFTATGTYTDNTTQNITSAVTWSSSSPAIATVSNASGSNGLATSQSVGSTTVSAAIGSISGSTTLTVNPAALVSIAVTPANASIAAGTTQQYVATGTYTDGTTRNLTSTVTWSSSTPADASISNASGSQGLATSTTQGSTTITAALGSISGSTGLTVTPATLVSIAVTPANQSIADGTSQQYTAIGTYTDGSTQNLTQAVAWTSSTTGVASISNASGSKGLASSATQGSTTITAALGSVSGSTPLTVTAATLTSITVTPALATINVGATQQYVATGHYTDGSTQVLTSSVTWTSSNTADATVSNASGSYGLATGTGAGTLTITATAAPGSTAGSATLTVVQPYAYVINSAADTISQYAIAANGALTATGTPVATGVKPFFEIIDATNQYLYEVNITDGTIGQYSIGAGGALSLIQTTATGMSPAQPVIDATNKYLYVQNIGSNSVSEYSIGGNGALTSIGPGSIATGTLPFGIGIEPSNKYLYATNNDDTGGQGTISEYSIGANGVLTALNPAKIVADANSPGLDKIAFDPTGKYAYVTNSTLNLVEEFQIGSNGQLTKFGTVAAGAYARSIILDKSGTYVYVVNSSAGTISEYSIGSGGALTTLGPGTVNITGGTNPFDITLDPTGHYVYVPLDGGTNTPGSTVAEFSIGTDGTLTQIGTVATPSGGAPSGVATTH
jgi:urocanate hydratase